MRSQARIDQSFILDRRTTQSIADRWKSHKCRYKRWIAGKQSALSIFYHFKELGIENFNIKAIQNHNVQSIDQLHMFEQLVIDKTENTCNKQRAYYPKPLTPKPSTPKPLTPTSYDKQYHDQYRKTNHARINAKVDCDCGGKYTKKHKAGHLRTQKQIDWSNTQ
jgi:cation diffusion facilitator CzcD-associated flavoprotein CzcO